MCIAGQPQFAHLRLSTETLDEWYEWFYGEDIAGRRPEEQIDTDNDSMLVIRQMYLTSLAYQGLAQCHPPRVGYSFLEHPRDPMEVSASPQAHKCSSLWVTRAYIKWANQLHHHRIKFDQCRLGQMVVKATTLSTDLPLHHWQDLRCNHSGHQPLEDLQSSDLSRYPDQMMLGLAQAIAKVLQVPPKPTNPNTGDTDQYPSSKRSREEGTRRKPIPRQQSSQGYRRPYPRQHRG